MAFLSKSTELSLELLDDYEMKRAVLVGDHSSSDIQAAKDNGIWAIGCRFGFAAGEELAEADVVIEQFRELAALDWPPLV
jgi:phosphoglycolate phosphatase